ncbi:MAG: bifunctional glutamate N-acetyltransferase/amino-acid acetyltransferase ArgJ [Peptococcaceae bacterium]|nr:bifunctional glutamate N-acetyltransferase/amino-acid acetyltransferase ArgJ [Peptococcaceae bacterium]
MKTIPGGVCAPKGFSASGIHCGIRKNKEKKDLALILSRTKAAAASVYTQNLVKGAPIDVTKANIADGYAQAIICNSGNANTCNADGIEIAQGMCRLLAKAAGISAADVIVASTGVIGQPLSLEPMAAGMDELVKCLTAEAAGSKAASAAIMTTDTAEKEVALEFTLGGKTCRMGGIAKGSGMIHPNMATMLVFITTDAAISPGLLQKALSADIEDTFNMISVDGDTSTNDMVSVMANGQAGNPVIDKEGEDYAAFAAALNTVTTWLSKAIARDGEGATKLLECAVSGAKDKAAARKVAKSVICSNLLKAAMFGADANWGRILCAIGYSGADVDVNNIDVNLGSAAGRFLVCQKGRGVDFSEEFAKKVLTKDAILIDVRLNQGEATATAWGCDLTYDYVKINGDYRS